MQSEIQARLARFVLGFLLVFEPAGYKIYLENQYPAPFLSMVRG